MEFGTIFGLPAHPLFVHIPVVGIPLMALAVMAYVLVPSKPAWLFWTSGALTVLVTIATVLTAGSGEKLEAMLPAEDEGSALIHTHAELGEQTEIIVIIFAGLALTYLALDWWRRRSPNSSETSTHQSVLTPGRLRSLVLGLGIAAIIAGSVATVWDVRTGHAGAKSSWEDVVSSGEGG
jgi:hypothetical protein